MVMWLCVANLQSVLNAISQLIDLRPPITFGDVLKLDWKFKKKKRCKLPAQVFLNIVEHLAGEGPNTVFPFAGRYEMWM